MEDIEKKHLIKTIESGLDEAKLIIKRSILNSENPNWFVQDLPDGSRNFTFIDGDKRIMELKIYW